MKQNLKKRKEKKLLNKIENFALANPVKYAIITSVATAINTVLLLKLFNLVAS